jgi:hypothetical protein
MKLRDPKSRISEGCDVIVVKEIWVGAWCLFMQAQFIRTYGYTFGECMRYSPEGKSKSQFTDSRADLEWPDPAWTSTSRVRGSAKTKIYCSFV